MGRYRSSSSDEDRSRKSKKRKKRRSRSSSISSQQSRLSDTKGKRSRRKQRKSSRSRSQSLDRKGSRLSRRSRSRSPDRYGNRKHRSRSRLSDRRGSRRSRSPASRYGRSRSPSSRRPRSYSRSVSQERKRNSRSYSRERSSHNVDRDYTHRSSTDKHRSAIQTAGSPKLKGQPILESALELSEMTPFEQAEDRMRQALKAAEAAGEKLKCFSGQESTDSKNFMTSVAAIESDSFLASSFRSSRSARIKEEADSGLSQDDAIFGSLAISGFILTPDPDIKPVQLDSDSIMHPSLYCDLQEKMDRWISRLSQLRRRKLEGEAMQ